MAYVLLRFDAKFCASDLATSSRDWAGRLHFLSPCERNNLWDFRVELVGDSVERSPLRKMVRGNQGEGGRGNVWVINGDHYSLETKKCSLDFSCFCGSRLRSPAYGCISSPSSERRLSLALLRT